MKTSFCQDYFLGGWTNSVVKLNTLEDVTPNAMSSDQLRLLFICDFGHTKMSIFKR
jgi:hypothetical protein